MSTDEADSSPRSASDPHERPNRRTRQSFDAVGHPEQLCDMHVISADDTRLDSLKGLVIEVLRPHPLLLDKLIRDRGFLAVGRVMKEGWRRTMILNKRDVIICGSLFIFIKVCFLYSNA